VGGLPNGPVMASARSRGQGVGMIAPTTLLGIGTQPGLSRGALLMFHCVTDAFA
jgi:hypothetical protein